ncbi:energy-coupling factor transporter ATPase [Erysipelothrix sp. HDW6C]|uniref:energy-coupling factor transporter ATPase n=1 Tax=Erysipelothrix sp. HDW6C TaxID=2714930 RepID=UPI0014086AF8|nr:energy-coupling factor transporter ATPase [Erysipelothrix sp. HDW6C]QIK69825.1 energy-coupling factor transporter ATPase [Erysipelothrix sp. HDW6C]
MPIVFKNVGYEYGPKTPFAHTALNDINAEIKTGSLTAIIGATGSGKSTLVQHLNGLLQPTSGEVEILDHTMVAGVKSRNLKQLRSQVGLVFQFPEMQLFEETIYKDVSFGPKNFGFSEADIKENVEKALTLVGIDKELWERSPLDLSGGQKRRVAIAGVLATDPNVIVLDEPTAGLDPQGSKDMMNLFIRLNKDFGKTIIMVTHDMDHVLNYAEDVLVLDKGSVYFSGKASTFFKDQTMLDALGFVAPKILQLKTMLLEKGIDTKDSLDLDAIVTLIKEARAHE